MFLKPLSNLVFALLQLMFWTTCVLQEGNDRFERFGNRQVEQLMDDRPELRAIIESNQFLFDWLSERFNGGSIDLRVYWNALEPSSGFPAESILPYPPYPAQIRLTSRADLTKEDKCVALMFEFFNQENETAFKRLSAQAFHKSMSREKFAERATLLELQAAVRLQPILDQVQFRTLLGNSEYYKGYMRLPKNLGVADINEWNRFQDSYNYWLSAYDKILSSKAPHFLPN